MNAVGRAMAVTVTLIVSTCQAITHVSVNQALKVQAHNVKVRILISTMSAIWIATELEYK